MQNNPFAHLLPQQSPQQPVRQDPIVAPAPPSERRAERDQQLQETRTAQQMQIDAERLRLAQQGEQRQQEQQDRQAAERAQGFDATEGERKAGAFLIRALGANESFERAGVGARSLPAQALRDAFPSFENYFVSGERQIADSAQDEFIAASLRQDSGAAIPTEELEKQRRIYFPMPGDGPEVLEQKRQARLRAIAGLEQSAGRLREPSMQKWEEMRANLFPEEAQPEEPQAPGMAVPQDLYDPETPPDKTYGDDGEGNPLLVMQNGKLFALANGRLADGKPLYVDPQGEFAGIVIGASQDLYDRINKTEQSLRERRGEGGFKEVAGRGITLGLSDEAAGIGQAIGSALSGDFNLGANFEAGRAVEDLRIEQGRENLGMAATGLELLGAGGAIRAASGFGQARQAVQSLRNSGQAVNRASVQGALRNRATVEGAGIGVLAGGAEGSTLAERGQNALIGGVAGGALGRVGQNVQNALSNRARAVPATGGPVTGAQAQQAADRQSIDLIPAVTGGTTTQRLTSGARQGFISDRPIAGAVERMEGQAAAARGRASAAAGQAVDAVDAGELVRRGAQVYSRRTSQIGGNLYDRADRMAGNVKLPLPKATQALDDEIAALEQSPTADTSGLLNDLRTLRSQIGQGQFSIPGIRAMRTDLRQEIVAQGLRYSPSDAIYSRVLKAAEEDLIGGLRQAGRDNAANALQTATRFWRQRVETIDEVLDPLLGKNAPRRGEQILAAVERLAKPDSGSSVNLGRLMRAMPNNEASAVRATIINRLGRPTAGASEVDRAGFSFSTFLTNWNNMSPRARSALFPRQSVDALNDLATISSRVKAAGASANTSNTSGALISQGAISGGLFYLDPLVAAGGALSQYGFGKLLASPRFARLLANAPRQGTPQARRAFSERLGNLAQSEPTIAREIAEYQRALAANDNTASALAAEEQQNIPQ